MTKAIAKLLFVTIIVSILSTCVKFGGFSDFSEADTGNITKVEAYFTEENLAKFYDSVSEPEEDYASCSINIGKKKYRGWLKVRGFTSRKRPKKNISVKIEENGAAKVYALMHEQDTFFKNRIIMYAYNNYVFKGATLSIAPDTESVAFFINDEYIGYYAMMDVYSESQLKQYKKGNKNELFKIYIRRFGSEPLIDLTEKKFPKDKDFSTIELLVTNLNKMNNEEWNRWIEKYLDIDDFIRYMVVHNYFGVCDTESCNYYIYNYGKLLFLPWDNELGMELEYDCFFGNNKLTKRILAVPAVRTAYIQAMKDFVADTVFLEDLKLKVNQWYDESYKAIDNDPVYYGTTKSAKRCRDHIINFIDNRGNSEAYKRHFQ